MRGNHTMEKMVLFLMPLFAMIKKKKKMFPPTTATGKKQQDFFVSLSLFTTNFAHINKPHNQKKTQQGVFFLSNRILS